MQQREGRIVRQGNENPEVEIYSYVTENTFDKLTKQSKITYEYFDGDDKEYTDKEMKKKQKLNKKRLEKYLKTNPDMKPID